MEEADAPSQNDAARTWPSALRHTIDRKRDAELANAVSTTEIMVADFYKTGYLSQRTGQTLLDMMRHPLFNPNDILSNTIVQATREIMQTNKLWVEIRGMG